MLPEVVILVLQHLYIEQRDAFLACMRVCKAWYGFAVPILWQNICLPNPKEFEDGDSLIHKFLDHAASSTHLCHTQTMTVQLIYPLYRVARYELMSKLAERLKKMQNLVSLSLSVDVHTSLLAHPELSTAMQNFPASLKHLEISQLDRHEPVERVEKCDSLKKLSQILPNLQTLRLHDTRLCPGMFSPPGLLFQNLQEFSVNHLGDVSRCSCEVDEAVYRSSSLKRKLRESTIDQILASARSAIENQCLPQIKNFVIVGRTGMSQLETENFSCAFRADIVLRQVTCYPYHEGPPHETWARLHSRDEPPECFDVITYQENIMNWIQHADWSSYNNGSRLHDTAHTPSYLTKKGQNLDWRTDGIARATKRRLNDQRPKIRLYYWEGRAQKSLLHVEMRNDLTVPLTIYRERPIEEQLLEPGSKHEKEVLDMVEYTV